MFYVYILKSQVKPILYIGYTTNIKIRINEHNQGLSKTTSRYKPWDLVYLEGYVNENKAIDKERKLKQFGKVYSQLKRRIPRSLGTQKVRG